MCQSRIFLVLFITWFQVALIWNGCNVDGCMDFYTQYYTYEQPGYDYTQYVQQSYPTYGQPILYDYQYYYSNPYQDEQKPVIIIVNNEDKDDDWELFDLISLITSLTDKHNEPIYIPYPICCDCDYDFDWDCDCYSDCGCKNKGKCNCKNDRGFCDCDSCDHKKRGRSKSKSHCSKSRSKSERGRCNKCETIKHKCDCY